MDEKKLREAVVELHETKMMYGSPDAPFWFVGLEEANGSTPGEAEGLIYGALGMHQDFVKDGVRPLRGHKCHEEKCPDNCQYSASDNKKSILPCLLSGNDYDAKIQRTWGGYIKLLLKISDGDFTKNSVKSYQKYHLTDIDNTPLSKQSALLELFPLHCKRNNMVWPYSSLSHIQGLEHLASEHSYWHAEQQSQWDKLVAVIENHKPSYVYLASQVEFNNLLAGTCHVDTIPQEICWGNGKKTTSLFASLNGTTLFTGYHPGGGRGITDTYWRHLGLAVLSYSDSYLQAA